MSLCFYIIYTPGTVKPLRILLYSLLKWSDCHFCLVANGCSPTEAADLEQFCAVNPRLSYKALPTDKVMLHGEALNYLQAQNQHTYFCFMDSDMYAVDAFLPPFLSHLEQYSAIFSGAPARLLPANTTFMVGYHTHTPTDVCLGLTYFAIYHNQTVSEIRRLTGIGFAKYRWEEIPEAWQQQFEALGVKCQIYDTAKVLNLLLHLHGHKLHLQPCLTLHHLAGVSRFYVVKQRTWWKKLRTSVGSWLRKQRGNQSLPSFNEATPYFARLLLALAEDDAVPAQPVIDDPEMNDWVTNTRSELFAIQAEFSKAT